LDSEELLLWQVLEAIDPYGQRRLDIQFARLAKTVMDSVGGKDAAGKPFTVSDFLLKFEQPDVKKRTRLKKMPRQSLKVQETLLVDWITASNASFAEKVNSG
jgi:hypothetical protein